MVGRNMSSRSLLSIIDTIVKYIMPVSQSNTLFLGEGGHITSSFYGPVCLELPVAFE